MMNKWNILKVVCFLSLCVFLCGCGAEGTGRTIIIGSAADGGAEVSGGADAEHSDKALPGTEGSSTEGQSAESESDSKSDIEEQILVYVCGAVMNPGVVSVPAGSRVEDALQAAGGFKEDAAREAINLATWITDGQMIYFPTEEENFFPTEEENFFRTEEENFFRTEEENFFRTEEENFSAGLVNINTADAALLCTLPGIGESRAADIIAYREQNGAFKSCEDIMKVSGIKESVYGKICDKITVK